MALRLFFRAVEQEGLTRMRRQEYELAENEVKVTLEQFKAKFLDENGDIVYVPAPSPTQAPQTTRTRS